MNKSEFNMMIERYLMIRYTNENLKKMGAPDHIIKSSDKGLLERQKKLLSMNVDIEKYLRTPDGMFTYLNFCAEKDHTDDILDKCSQCKNYGWFPTDQQKEFASEYRCTLLDEIPMCCKQENPTGKHIATRIQDAMFKCNNCPDVIKFMNNTVDIEEFKCPYDYNVFNCPKYPE